jgi:phytoene desaturase
MKKIVIVGGGVAGLSAGIFAQKNGFESIILEKNQNLGGECTGWDRYGYHIDGCIHWLVGTKQNTAVRELWNIVGALDGVEIFEPESFMAVETNGVTVHFYRDINKLKSSWLEISPEENETIEGFCRDIEALQSFQIPVGKPMDMMNIFEKINYFVSIKDMGQIIQKYEKISVQELSEKFMNKSLREAIASFMPEGDFSASSVIFALSTFTGGQSSIPFGGSRSLSMRMVDKYLSLGGTIEVLSEVVKLDIEKSVVKKVMCENGKSYQADYIIVACDAQVLYERLLSGNHPDLEFQKRYKNPEIYPLASNIYIGIGYEGTMDDIPRTLKFPVSSIDIVQNKKAIDYLQLTHYSYEPDFAPKGHTVMTVAINQFQSDLLEWENLIDDRSAYILEKARIGSEVIRAIENRFPHMSGKLELLDVATPQTYKRYCNAHQGAFMGFWPTIHGKTLIHKGYIKGLDNIVLSGQWLQPPGGLPIALITGRDTIMRLCKRLKKPFVCI